MCFCRLLQRRTHCQSLQHTWTHTHRQRGKRKRKLTCEGLSDSPQNGDPEQERPHTSGKLPAGKDDSSDNPNSTDTNTAGPQNVDWREFRCCQTNCCTPPCDISGHCSSCMPATIAKQAKSPALLMSTLAFTATAAASCQLLSLLCPTHLDNISF